MVLYESRLSSREPCPGHLFSANAAHDLGSPNWDSSTVLLPRRQTCKEWLQSANFQRPTYRVACHQVLANQRSAHVGAVQVGCRPSSCDQPLWWSAMFVHNVLQVCLPSSGARAYKPRGWEGELLPGEDPPTHGAEMLFLPPTSDQIAASSALRRHSQASARSDFMASLPRLTAHGLGAGSEQGHPRSLCRSCSFSASTARCRGGMRQVHE